MNDRFKFRVWDNNKKEYLYKGYIHRKGYLVMPTMKNDYSLAEAEGDFVVEQCTGLKDKNGNLIYDGDIIKSPSNSNVLRVYQEYTGLWRCVEYRVGGRKELPLYQLCDYGVEICGNIHENEELYNG